uniref:stemmadenine O-acetyltransferase-like n=1 Tax=Erigeron canadensis TaxID=72917 RepID=UPI001CB9A8BE|nr:stemmadenine O-acetyltransferase-like [Erigeron canadensis]
MKDCMTIDCNDSGVPFVVARMNCRLDELLKRPPMDSMCDFVPFRTNCFQDNTEGLVGIQVTIFDCGGIVIGVCMHHRISDAMSMRIFIKCWADETAIDFQMPKADVVNPDFTTARELFPPVEFIPKEIQKILNYNHFEESKFVQRRYVFDKNAIASLQSKTSNDATPNKPTRNIALTSFIWKHMMEASRIIRGSSFNSLETFMVNLRPRFQPPLSSNTFGNLWWIGFRSCDVSLDGEIMKPELCNIMDHTHLDNDYVKELQKPGVIFQFIQGIQNDANESVKTIVFSNWCNLGHYNIDFGWGRPIWIAYAHKNNVLNNRGTFLMDSPLGIEIWVIAKEDEISILESNQEFLEYASINPSVIQG